MNHVEMKDLILVYEDLRGDEKTLADKHLEECSKCRHLLGELQKVETVDVGWGNLPCDPGDENLNPVGHLNAQEKAEAHLSRQQLLEAVIGESVVVGAGSPWWRAHSGLMGMALAACLTLVIWNPWHNPSSDLILDFRMTHQSVVRGDRTDIKPGDPFVMRFNMGADGWPVVVKIVDGEKPELLFPTDLNTPMKLAAQRAVVLPPPGSGTLWHVNDQAVYLLTISESEKPTVKHLDALLDQVIVSEKTKVAVEEILKKEFGNCDVFGR